MTKSNENPCRVAKLIDRLEAISLRLEANPDLAVHRNINQFFYMEKAVELSALQDQLEEMRRRTLFLTAYLEKEYACVFRRWAREVRMLNALELEQREHGQG